MSQRLNKEMDFINIIDSIRQLQAHLKSQYDDIHRALLAFDKQYFVNPDAVRPLDNDLIDEIKLKISSWEKEKSK